MSNLSQFLPVTSAAQVKSSPVKYLLGNPYQYKTDMRTGVLTLTDDTVLTKKDSVIKLRVVAIHIFKAKMFAYSERLWSEIFFVNGIGAISMMRFHGYSVEKLLESVKATVYRDIDIPKSILEISFKVSKSGTFRIAQFQFEDAPENENEAWAKLEIQSGDDIFDQLITHDKYRGETKI
jgi:hypothetical protein